MFYIISKTIDVLAMPLSIAFFSLLIGFCLKNRRKRRIFVIFGFLWLYTFSSPILVNMMLKAWEPKRIQPADLTKTYEFAVVLTGGMNKIYDTTSHHVWVGRTFDRTGQAFQLYKAGKVRKILITGGEGLFRGSRLNDEALGSYHFLVKAGVDSSDIILEQRSVNTRENAKYTAELLQKYNTKACVVITSAYHLPRSVACFRKVGLEPVPYPAAFLQVSSMFWFDKLIPNEESLFYGFCVWHELVGYAIYKVMGYV